jgi:hypothetical protein
VATHIHFGVKGKSLQVEEITRFLGITPTSGFNPHEPYLGKTKVGDEIILVNNNRPSFGVWHFRTEEKRFPDMVDHALYLLEVLEPAKENIAGLLRSPDYEVVVAFWYEGPVGFDIPANVLSRLASLCHRFTFRFFESDLTDDLNKI